MRSNILPINELGVSSLEYIIHLGDNAVECTGDDIILIEDYREDIEQIIGGKSGN